MRRYSVAFPWKHASLQALGIVLVLLVWYLFHLRMGEIVPSPIAVAQAATSNLFWSSYFEGLGLPPGGYWPHIVATTETVLAGFLGGCLLGALSGLSCARFGVVYNIVNPVVTLIGTIPILIAAPFFLIWFGVSWFSEIALVCLYTALTIHLFALRAVGNVDRRYIEYAATLGADETQRFRCILIPACIPELFGGLRIALGAGWSLATVTELLGSTVGIGRVITATSQVYDLTAMIGAIVWISCVAIALDRLLMVLRAQATKWMPAGKLVDLSQGA